ncbi:hypothetical protein GGR51DRAFT_563230 [Nemania sp. FL0031]|nr:hypothetical protein GGR51DRAFT_563230 [Nemania sp. FL0031]
MATRSSTWLDDAFRAAKRNFINGLKNPSVYDFSNLQTIDDVYNETDKIQREQAKTKTLRALKKIEPFILGINDYASTIDTFIQAKAEILALIWGPLRLLLQMASSLSIVFEKMVKVLADIGLALPQFKKYTELFEGNDQVKQAMCLFYADILDFYQILLNFLDSRRLNTFFEALWPNIRGKIDVVQSNIERHKLLMTSQVTLEDIAQSYEARRQAMNEYEKQQKFRERQDFEVMVSEYSPLTYHMKLSRIFDTTAPGSGGWLALKSEFIQWADKNNTTNRCLWLYGIPGSGKTFLAAGSIRRLQGNQNLVLFVFLTHDNQTAGGVIQVMHSLIFQASKDNPDLMPLVYGYVKSDQQTMPNNNKFESNRDFVKELLIKVLDICKQVFIVVDGLDELEERPRRSLLETLLQIVEESKVVRLLISSREERDVMKQLEGRAVSLRADHNNAEDIQLYADSELRIWLEDLRDLEADDAMFAMAKKSVASIVQASEGMILYTRLVLQVLKDQGTPSDIELQLQNLPQGLDQAYARVLYRIREKISVTLRAVVKRVLHWILCARSPLREEQILQALVIEPGARDFTKGRKEFRDIRKECGPIIEDVDGVVRFVHFSVKEYMLKHSNGFLDIRTANMDAAIACSTYLRFTSLDVLFDARSSAPETALNQRILDGDLVFFEYAATEWLEHVKDCQPEESLGELASALSALFDRRKVIAEPPILAESSTVSSYFDGFKDRPDIRRYLVNAEKQMGKARLGLFEDDEDDCPGLFTILRILRQRREMILCQSPQHMQGCQCNSLHRLYGSTVFYCHKPYCSRNRRGFESRTARDEHLAIHLRKYRFLDSAQMPASTGFRSNEALSDPWSETHIEAHANLIINPSASAKLSDYGELQDMLVDAVTQNNIEGIRALVSSCASTARLFANVKYPWRHFGATFIGYAAWRGSDMTLQYILGLNVEGFVGTDYLGMALAVAIETKRLQCIKLLLSLGADIDERACLAEAISSQILDRRREGDIGLARTEPYPGYERALSLWDPELMSYLVKTCGVQIRKEISGKFCQSPAVLNLAPREIRDRLRDLETYIVGPEVFNKGLCEAIYSRSIEALGLCAENGANPEYLSPEAHQKVFEWCLENGISNTWQMTLLLKSYSEHPKAEPIPYKLQLHIVTETNTKRILEARDQDMKERNPPEG